MSTTDIKEVLSAMGSEPRLRIMQLHVGQLRNFVRRFGSLGQAYFYTCRTID